MNINHMLVNEVPQFFPWPHYESDCLQNCSNNVLIKPSLHNTYNNSCNYYNYSTKQHVLALFGHHQAYRTVVLVKVHSVAFTYGIPWFTIVLSIFFELQVQFNNNYHTIKSDIKMLCLL